MTSDDPAPDLGDGLIEILTAINELRRAGDRSERREVVEAFVERLFGASRRLAVYGSLAPGESNHAVIADLGGRWSEGLVRGDKHEVGWGATAGYPAMRWRPDARPFPVSLLVADSLRGAWARLDEFEGEDYCRVLVPVSGAEALPCVANIYEGRAVASGDVG
jgi:gamma-glutamylcyclotransferase (GGCT)/AIG2-like uncharacterized protein YtfP